MKKILSLLTVILLVICLVLTTGCGKKNKDKNTGKDSSSNYNIPIEEGMPSTPATEKTDDDGNVVYVEDVITEDALNNPAEYNKQQATSSKTESTPTNETSSTTEKVESGTSSNIAGTQDTDTGYDPNNLGWIS